MPSSLSSHPADPPFDLDTVDSLLTTTRAVRRRLDLERPVEPDVVAKCLELATQAPTGGNTQGWRWLVITDETTRQQIADVYRRAGLERFTAKAASLQDRAPAAARSYEDGAYLASILERVPVLVLPCVRGSAGDSNHQAASLFGSILPAVWSFALALRSRGLGTVLTTTHLQLEQEVASLLEIPDGYTQVALLPVAYTVGTEFRAANRMPIAEVTYWNRWGNPTT